MQPKTLEQRLELRSETWPPLYQRKRGGLVRVPYSAFDFPDVHREVKALDAILQASACGAAARAHERAGELHLQLRKRRGEK